ncbi:MAG: sensor histidine kinase [Calditrichia bacterium]
MESKMPGGQSTTRQNMPNQIRAPISKKNQNYNFQFKHLIIIFFLLISFLLSISYLQKASLQNLLLKTQEWYQQDSAERLANLTATSLELLFETASQDAINDKQAAERVVRAFNIILSQQVLQQNVDQVAILIHDDNRVIVIDDGMVLFNYFFEDIKDTSRENSGYAHAIKLFKEIKTGFRQAEEIRSIREGRSTFHVFVPFVPQGELVGAVYVQNTPDFGFITREIISNFDETALIFASLILFGLLAVFFISSYTVKERDEAREELFEERETLLRDAIHHQKESLFTKRIYHTHHKAEKVMGFIKEDLRNLVVPNIEDIKFRVTRYANFISRVIYDMKWYDPPLQTIRNPIFKTDLNEVIRFIVDQIFLRTAEQHGCEFKLNLDDKLPTVSVNEFVVWEVLEPLMQNSIEHSNDAAIIVTLRTEYLQESGIIHIFIYDNGNGFPEELLQTNTNGVKRLFLENISTKTDSRNSGYGCYLAYEISKRCGWTIDAENPPDGGSCIKITVQHSKV